MKYICLIILSLYSMMSCAGKWPIITSIKSEYVGYNNWQFHITQKLLEIGPSVDVVMPNSYVQLTHRHNPNSEDVVGGSVKSYHTTNTDTISKIASEGYNESGSAVTIVDHNGADPTGSECVAYIVNPAGPYTGQPWSSVFVPGGCMVIPPADQWCKITTPELVLDHGSVTLKNAEGSVATDTVGVQCTTDTAVTFNLITQDKYVYLDEGKSEITVDDKPLNTKIDLKQGDSQLPVKDLLTGITTEGFHTGSSVLVMMPY